MRLPAKRICDFVCGRKRIYIINDAQPAERQSPPTCPNERPTKEGGSIIPRRYIVVFLGFLSFSVLNTQRVNLVIALVTMTNSTASEMTQGTGQECSSTTKYNATENSVNKGIIFNWNSEIQGFIVGSSFVGFIFTQFLGGRLAETLGAKQVLIFSLFCASLCNLLFPVAATWSTYLLIMAQFLKGMAQGFIQPAIFCLMVRWYPSPERSFLSSLTFSGYPLGALFGGIASGALCDTNFLGGWPSVFYVFGFFGMILVLLLQFCVQNCPEEDKAIKDSELKYIICNQETKSPNQASKIPWLKIILSLPTWALFAGIFGQYWMTFYFISIHPKYLSTILNFNVAQSGLLSSLPYIPQFFVTWSASYASDWIVRKKYASTDFVRKACNTLSSLGFSLSLLGVAYSGCSSTLNTVCSFFAMGCIGLGFPGSLTVPMDMTVKFVGTLTGLASTIASTCGFIIPVVVGELTNEQQTMAQWNKVFILSGFVVMVSGVFFHLCGSADLQDWEKTEEVKTEATFKEPSAKDGDSVVISGVD